MAPLIIHVLTYPYCNLSAFLVVGGGNFCIDNSQLHERCESTHVSPTWYQDWFSGKPIDTFPVHRKTIHNFDAPKNPGEESVAERSQGCEQGVIKDVNLWIPRLKGHIRQ